MRLLILALAALLTATAARAVPCGELFAYSGSYVEELADDECLLRDSFDLGVSGTRQTYKIYDASRSAYSGRAWHRDLAHEAMERSALFYGPFARMPSATIIFGGGAPRVDAGDGGSRSVLGETYPKIFGETCVLTITDATLDGRYGNAEGERELRLTIAHELFHCVQYYNWERKVLDAMLAHAAWWVEGTAEYIQHEVYPEYAFDPSRGPDFDAQIGTEGLLGAQHSNAVFFAYYAEAHGGPNQVILLIERMANNPGREVQLSALAAVPGIAGDFHKFAKRYLDRELRSPGGHAIAVSPRAGVSTRIADPGEREERVKPWTVRARRYVFPAGENWKILSRTAAGGVVADFRYDELRGAWREGTFEALACAEERTVLMAATAAEQSDDLQSLQVRFEEIAGDERTCPCPLGPWTIARDDINEKFPVPAATFGEPDSEGVRGWRFTLDEGSPSLEFRNDGTSHYAHHLTFLSDEKPRDVPAMCATEACVRACSAGMFSRRDCSDKRTVRQRFMYKDRLSLDWTWRRRENMLLRTLTGGEGGQELHFNDGFGWRLVKVTPRRVEAGPQSGNPFRCVGAELYLDPTPAGGAGSIDDLIARLEGGNEQQRQAADQLRALRDRAQSDPEALEALDQMAQGAASGVAAYPYSGRFIR
jgi:hypothetical protein